MDRIKKAQLALDKVLAEADEAIDKLKTAKRIGRKMARNAVHSVLRLFYIEPAEVGQIWISSAGKIMVGPEVDPIDIKKIMILLHHMSAHILYTVKPEEIEDPAIQNAICSYAALSTCPVRFETAKKYGFVTAVELGIDPSRKLVPLQDVIESAILNEKKLSKCPCIRLDRNDRWETIEQYVSNILRELDSIAPSLSTYHWFSCAKDLHSITAKKDDTLSPEEFAAFLDRLTMPDEPQKSVTVAFYVGCGKCHVCKSIMKYTPIAGKPNTHRVHMMTANEVVFNEAMNGIPAVHGHPIPKSTDADTIVFVVSCDEVDWPDKLPEEVSDWAKVVCIKLSNRPVSKLRPYIIPVRWNL